MPNLSVQLNQIILTTRPWPYCDVICRHSLAGSQEEKCQCSLISFLMNMRVIGNCTAKVSTAQITTFHCVQIYNHLFCILEIKPCGLFPRIRDVCSPKIYYNNNKIVKKAYIFHVPPVMQQVFTYSNPTTAEQKRQINQNFGTV